eukprot:g39934.t1
MLENQMQVRQKEIEELKLQAQALGQEDTNIVEVDSKRKRVEERFQELLKPIEERRRNLMASKEGHQFNRDLEDEVELGRYVEVVQDVGDFKTRGHNVEVRGERFKQDMRGSFFYTENVWNEIPEEVVDAGAVTMFKRHLDKYVNQKCLEGYGLSIGSVGWTLQKEIQGHQPRIDDIADRGETMAKAGRIDSEVLRARLGDLQKMWKTLIEETDKRSARLEESQKAQQFYFDAAEAEAWMGEQELHMMSEERAK